jgi:hypothetical protein
MGLPQGILNVASGAASKVGSALHLPEMGYSEAIQDPRRGFNSNSSSNMSILTNSPMLTPGMPGYGQPGTNSATNNTKSNAINQGSAVAADPYAAYGGTAKFNQLKADFSGQKNNIMSGANDAINNAGTSIGSGILDLISSLSSGQRAIDSQAVQNELAKKQGLRGVMDHLGQGIRSGGVMLANKNAGDSSAAGALADAYGQIGRQEASQIGNQYAQGMEQVGLKQQDLSDQKDVGMRHIAENKTQVINNIVSDTQTKLAALDSAIAGASLPDRINIEGEKNNVRNQALAALQQYDQQLQQGVGNVHAQSQDDRMAKANELANAGVAPEGAYSFTEHGPAQFQGTGPFASSLPLFTLNKKSQSA